MRRPTWRVVAAMALLVLGGAAWAAGVPWKPADNDEPVVAATLEEMKADLGQARFKRVVGLIEAKVALADKAMEAHDKEMQKPVEKRQATLLQRYKVQAAQMHVAAAKAALRAKHMVQKASHRACIQETFEVPNKKKAVALYLDLGIEARAEGNLRQAALVYKEVLAIDPENAEAKAALKELAREYQQALRDRKYRSKSSGGGSDDEKKPWKIDDDDFTDRDWGDWREHGGFQKGW